MTLSDAALDEALARAAALELHNRTGNGYDALPLEEWLIAVHVLETGAPYSFEGHDALLGIMADTHLRKVVMKAAQIGATTAFIGAALYCADQGKPTIYYLPDDTLIPDIHALRVKPVFEFSPYLRARVRNRDAVQTIELKAPISFIGLKGKLAVESRPAKVLMFDEVDKAEMPRVTIAKERLGHTPTAEQSIYYLSKPSVPGYGIAALYDESDRREYMTRCKCGEWTPVDWAGVVSKVDDNVWERKDREWVEGCGRDIRVYCRCGRPIDRDAAFEWRATQPGRDYHGYKLSRLHFRVHTVADLYREFMASIGNESRMQNFYNSWLGEPYVPAGAGFTVADLDGAKRDYLPVAAAKYEPCVLGVDPNPGAGNHWAVADMKGRVLNVGVTDWAGLDALFTQYKIVGGVIDGRGDTGKALEFQKKHPEISLADYVTDALVPIAETVRDGMTGAARWIKLDRTVVMDAMVGAVRSGGVVLPRNAENLGAPGSPYGSFYQHLLNIARITEETSKGIRYVWRESGPDHFAHAMTYMVAAFSYGGRGEVFTKIPKPILDPQFA